MWREASAGLCWRRGTGVPLGALDAVASGRPIKGRPDSHEYPPPPATADCAEKVRPRSLSLRQFTLAYSPVEAVGS
jgi:hypothetical protein